MEDLVALSGKKKFKPKASPFTKNKFNSQQIRDEKK